jgi:hypothetical protein
LYDVNDERIAEGANNATTTYPFTFYNVATSSSGKATFTKHIFANGEDVADVQGSTTTDGRPGSGHSPRRFSPPSTARV